MMLRVVIASLFVVSTVSLDSVFPIGNPRFFIPDSISAAAPPCISTRMAFCQSAYNSDLNITDGADWNNPQVMIDDLRNRYFSGVDSFLRVCQARRNFATCLGDQYNSCMSVVNFVDKGASLFNAYTYVQIFVEQEFDCVGGFIQMSKNFLCWNTVVQNNQQYLQNCFNTFFNVTDPNLYCTAANALENCVRKPFQDTCGAETGWLECERVRLASMFDKNCPTLVCNVNYNATSVPEKTPYMDNVEKMYSNKTDFHMTIKQLAEKAAMRQ